MGMNGMPKLPAPVFLLIQLVKLIVDGSINVRDHGSEHFGAISTKRMHRIGTEGWRDYSVVVCDHPKREGKLVLKGNVSVTAALKGIKDAPAEWEKLIPDGAINVLDYGKLTDAQIQWMVMDHGENAQLRIEAFNTVKRAYLSNPDISAVDLSVQFNDMLQNVLGGREVVLTGDTAKDRKEIAKRWAGLITQNWIPMIKMRKIKPVFDDHLAREAAPKDKDAGKYHFSKPEWTALYKAWQVDRENEKLADKYKDKAGFTPKMAEALVDIEAARKTAAEGSKAPTAVEATPLTAETLQNLAKESESMTFKAFCELALGKTVEEIEGLESALVKAEQTEGNALHDFFAQEPVVK